MSRDRLTSTEIRRQFIDYFADKHGHTIVPSAPVVPHDDPTLMFTVAGMVQFKDVFLGTGKRPYVRAVDTQKCIRAGGKHNDLEDVGRDTYHHTFFEMLGNWSFGDYFKSEAIEWAWDLLTNVWGLPKDRLYMTVFGGDEADGVPADDESAELWPKITGMDPSRVTRWGKGDNFWEMGPIGPCGPCSEIHIDLTPDGSGGALVNKDDPRVIELWNLVFIEFNRDSSGTLTPLPAKHVDTGLGLERTCAILQQKDSNYDTDVFTPLFDAIGGITGARPYGSKRDDPIDTAYRVIADHIRALTIALTDGAVPSNEGRGYVLRRILRRAVRHGWQTLGTHEPFLCRLVPTVVDQMGEAFPELNKNPQQVADLIREEEESFERTLGRGIELFEAACRLATNKQISGGDAFRLHDTYGFPLDLTQVMTEERGMTVDVEGFNKLMDEAREVARGAGTAGADIQSQLVAIMQKESLPEAEFVGYDATECTTTTSSHAFDVDGLAAIVTGKTPFYAEAGGQVGDVGTISIGSSTLTVTNTQKVGDVYFHLGTLEGAWSDGTVDLTLCVDRDHRARIMANHTCTHLLNRALRLHVNPQADQKGSLVDDEKTRFDFSHNAAVTDEHIEQVEGTVNADIGADLPVHYDYAPQAEALKINGLRAVFGEKYPPEVRVVSIGVPVRDLLADPQNADWSNRSIEFCGGTHLARTGDAEGFVIVNEEAVAKGIRRITALTGRRACACQAQGNMLLDRAEALHNAGDGQLEKQVAELTAALGEGPLPVLARSKIMATLGELQKKAKDYHKKRSREVAGDVVERTRQLVEQADGDMIVAAIEGADAGSLRTAMDVIKKKKPEAPMLLAAVTGDKLAFLAAVPKPLIDRGLKAGDWVREVAKAAGGGGGGRPDMAQAGGKDVAKLDEALRVARAFADDKLKNPD